jgi:hypothetical protein
MLLSFSIISVLSLQAPTKGACFQTGNGYATSTFWRAHKKALRVIYENPAHTRASVGAPEKLRKFENSWLGVRAA